MIRHAAQLAVLVVTAAVTAAGPAAADHDVDVRVFAGKAGTGLTSAVVVEVDTGCDAVEAATIEVPDAVAHVRMGTAGTFSPKPGTPTAAVPPGEAATTDRVELVADPPIPGGRAQLPKLHVAVRDTGEALRWSGTVTCPTGTHRWQATTRFAGGQLTGDAALEDAQVPHPGTAARQPAPGSTSTDRPAIADTVADNPPADADDRSVWKRWLWAGVPAAAAIAAGVALGGRRRLWW